MKRDLISSFKYLNLAAVFTLAVLMVFSAACGNDAEERAENIGGVTAAQIMENPAAYVGKVVTVSGEVEDLIAPQAFTMDAGLTTGELLVVGRDPYPAVPEAGNRAYVLGDLATVTGLVTMFVTADVEREIGWDLSPQLEAEFNARPVLIARNILFRPGPRSGTVTTQPVNTADANMMNAGNMMNTGANSANNAGANSANRARGDDVTDLAIVVDAPDRTNLIGRWLNVSRVRVQSVIGDRVFIVGPDETRGLPVVIEQEATPQTPTEGLVDINPGQTISLRGEIRRMPAQAGADRQFNGLLTQKELRTLANHKVYLWSDSNSIDILQRP